MKITSTLLLICISMFQVVTAQTLTPTFSNVDYVGNNAPRQKMDIYIPANLSAPAPLLVHIHGGGWSGGNKGAINVPYFQNSFDSGFVCVDIDYRVTGASVWPAQIEDCKTAIRFLRANASIYNIDTSRVGVIGVSAGGHLAAMLGTSADIPALEGLYQGYTNVSSRVQAVVDISGPTDFLLMDGYYSASCGTAVLIHDYNSPETHLFNIDSLHNYTALVETANPITYLTPDDAHFFFIHGNADCTVPTYQSYLFDSVLKVHGIPADTLFIAAGQGHGGAYYQMSARTVLYNNFFLKYLSNSGQAVIGISEKEQPKLFLYPNPVSNTLHFQFNNQSQATAEINISNLVGEIIYKKQIPSGINSMDISDISNGIYFISATINQQQTLKSKIVVLR